MSHTNNQWYPYEEEGSFYKLEDGVLLQSAMMVDGSRENERCEVDFSMHGVEDEASPGLRQIIEELKRLP